jgi:hypothetical protein
MQELRDRARYDIGEAARRRGYDHADRARRVLVGPGSGSDTAQDEDCAQDSHERFCSSIILHFAGTLSLICRAVILRDGAKAHHRTDFQPDVRRLLSIKSNVWVAQHPSLM